MTKLKFKKPFHSLRYISKSGSKSLAGSWSGSKSWFRSGHSYITNWSTSMLHSESRSDNKISSASGKGYS